MNPTAIAEIAPGDRVELFTEGQVVKGVFRRIQHSPYFGAEFVIEIPGDGEDRISINKVVFMRPGQAR